MPNPERLVNAEMKKQFFNTIFRNKGIMIFLLLITLVLLSIASLGETSEGIGATSGTCGINLTWALANGTLTISGTGSMRNYTSTSGAPWESVKSNITSIVISNGATSIGDYAFYSCTNLTGITLPETITTIGAYAFGRCSKLPGFSLGNRVKSLGNYALSECSALKSFSFPASLTSIGDYCFYGAGLRNISIPGTVTDIGQSAFVWCESLVKATFPDGLASIPRFIMGECYNLTEVIIGEGTEEIQRGAFEYCNNLTTVTIPASLSSVAESAFSGCSSLSDVLYAGSKEQANQISVGTNNTYFTGAIWHFYGVANILTLPSNLTKIEAEAFANVSAQKIVVPSSVKEIESKAFANCEKLMFLELPSGNITIADDILAACENVTIICVNGSQAQQWAIAHGFNTSTK